MEDWTRKSREILLEGQDKANEKKEGNNQSGNMTFQWGYPAENDEKEKDIHFAVMRL